jgi:multimeric flavodoxin WrbA
MNILVVNGSPRGREGVTYLIQEAFVRGASERGARVEEVFLRDFKIKPCLGCHNCWTKTPGQCAIKDDQAGLLEKVHNTDLLVMATPVYVDGMSGQTKVFVDRLVPLALPEFVLIDGHCRHPVRHEGPWNFLLISTCGFHELDNFDALVMHCKRICKNMHAEYLGHLLRPHGPLLQRRELLPAEIDRVLAAAVQAGSEVEDTGKLSDATMDAVSAEIIPKETYVAAVNSFWLQEQERASESG